MSKLIIVSNRLPVNIIKKGNQFELQPSVGGVATGLGSFYKSYNSVWIGWPGITENAIKGKKRYIQKRLESENCYPVCLTKKDIDNFYYGFCNKTIWPLFHYFNQNTQYNNDYWESYKKVNELFCDAVLKVAKPKDTIWIHDYQLLLLPQMVREKLPKANIGFFLHIPFPSSEIFRLLPWREDILKGMLGADLIGLHIYDYIRHFLHSVLRVLGYEHTFGEITYNGHTTRVDTFPMGIDYDSYANAVDYPDVQKEIKKIQKNVGSRKIILSMDRLDYTKGIPPRLKAFDMFLDKHPEYKEKVTLILVAVPSRTRVEHYGELKKGVEELVSSINGKHGTIGWTPVWYLYRSISFHTLIALYNVADVALITPQRDGMNLIAKEYIATKRNAKGVLILSEMAGAAVELGESLIVNPNNTSEMADAINEALVMPCKEQKARNRIMQDRLKRYNVERWANDFLEKLDIARIPSTEVTITPLTTDLRTQLIDDFKSSDDRLILLDFDGTLVPFADKPADAKPNKNILRMLKRLSSESKNEVIIASGRDRDTLDEWFGDLDLGFIAEHGAWIKERGGSWKTIEILKNNWKSKIRPLFEKYMDMTPGSFIEEKDFSLAWHFRKSHREQGFIRSLELKEALHDLTSNLGLEIIEGSKVIEVRNAGINKGKSASHWISKNAWDYIIAIGDDKTDEDLFEILPESAYSIKVGLKPSRAKFTIKSPTDTASLLRKLK
ncbi:MAG: bifunctional alpha,alpha-trehalose-phosphate synthase (UDP-forming)/trehalose-phosphatase [Thermoplasmata archaeon]|nr:MAG: bifunctional alpha,alpha-trehalose-phosphate synthase (UDP-forming)/trehalose-phosphatase [Thermoplasmata archaeon]